MKNDKLQSQTFLTALEYTKITLINNRESNCLGFAFSQTSENYQSYDLLTPLQIARLQNHREIGKVDICEAFIRKAKEFGYDVKLINSLDGTNNKVVFIVFGWYTDYIEGFGDYKYFFHIIRKNENGSFEHKLDWDTHANILTDYELLDWLESDIERYYFVVS